MLRQLYDDYGENFCAFFTRDMLTCISYPYTFNALSGLREWWVEPPEDPLTSMGDLVFLYSRWGNTNQGWSQLFTLERAGNQWFIHDHSTRLYPSEARSP